MKTRSNYWQLLPYMRIQWQTITKGFIGILGYVLAGDINIDQSRQ
ncbi:hypothetical protein [Nostoc sp. 'Lobaria pulmonaria (5183) cyanobiont']|nr:hypothetical protein [Nostoc sp. 'Lobaria pulmonaria (5183) cyanobiont']